MSRSGRTLFWQLSVTLASALYCSGPSRALLPRTLLHLTVLSRSLQPETTKYQRPEGAFDSCVAILDAVRLTQVLFDLRRLSFELCDPNSSSIYPHSHMPSDLLFNTHGSALEGHNTHSFCFSPLSSIGLFHCLPQPLLGDNRAKFCRHFFHARQSRQICVPLEFSKKVSPDSGHRFTSAHTVLRQGGHIFYIPAPI